MNRTPHTLRQRKQDETSRVSLMAHLVAYYPSAPASLAVGRELIDAGVSFLELQFPFSDPTADGPAIQAACTSALEAGFRTEYGFEMVHTLTAESDVPLFIMTYASVAVAHGIEWFVGKAADAGASGLIVPDLPPDYDEGLYDAGAAAGLHVVPVLVPTAASGRIDAALARRPAYVYAGLRKGITGAATEIGEDNLTFLARLREAGVHVMAGFGIRSREQVEALGGYADTVVVGSAFVETVARGGSVRAAARGLVYG